MAKFKIGDRVRVEGCGRVSGMNGTVDGVRKDMLGQEIVRVKFADGSDEEVPIDCVAANSVVSTNAVVANALAGSAIATNRLDKKFDTELNDIENAIRGIQKRLQVYVENLKSEMKRLEAEHDSAGVASAQYNFRFASVWLDTLKKI